ncbi:4-hydroxyphenylacetate 3-hydroxylase family protein [Alteribacillus sp. YIM 98480]|uniref:4-hydroxyphenylacetate 3-hydroxylase family protein n=1 Tax=Alteribacillus sp. YIM 98480 TaxID=2606599 RepID=UPI0018EEFCC3|nr:4-hydroxyphenylacetate 3-hydroxylase N-terminal domain-containing protein [Alteribacillus sp. YIM 98480]
MMRTGQEYLNSLNDGRRIYIDGKRVENIPDHPALSGISQTISRLYDHMADPKQEMTYTSPKTGAPVSKAYMIPRSKEDLTAKRLAMKKSADLTYGLVGRSPEHVANFLAGFASSPELFAEAGQSYADHVQQYYEYARDNHLFGSYAIVQPQIDRSKPAHEQEDPYLAAGVYEEKKDGIVLRGAQMLATSGAVSDFLFLSCIQPLRPGDENYAVSVAIPLNTPGLKLYLRRGYAMDKPSTYDYPLSTRFDETDALAVLEDVFVPWEQVFVYCNIDLTYKQFFSTPAHNFGNTQAQVRFVSKLQFIAGLVKKMTMTTGTIKMPPVQGQLGELISRISVFEGLLLAAESTAKPNKNGVYVPNPRFLYSAMALQPQLNNSVLELARELAGGGLIQLPSSYKDFASDETVKDIQRYVQSPGVTAEERVKLYKLAWDIIGSEFAGRHQQYERFYGGPPFVVKGQAYKYYGFEEADQLVADCLDSYSLEETLQESI